MTSLITLRKSALAAVFAVAALLGTGSAFAASSSAALANDPSGAKVQRTSSVKTMLGPHDQSAGYYYYNVQSR